MRQPSCSQAAQPRPPCPPRRPPSPISTQPHPSFLTHLSLPPLFPFPTLQTLSDPDRIAHCRVLAERGLSDLQAYVPAGAGAGAGAGGHTHSMLGGDISITLKGATTQSW